MSKFNYLLLFLLIISLNNVFAQEVETDSSIEEIVVTGSYLKTSPTDGASPIDVIDRDAIENFGANTVADLVRNLASNSGSENVPDSFTSGSTQGTSNINLRGLGLSSTLVLIDGRRQTVAGATANDGSVFVNTSIIPLIAIGEKDQGCLMIAGVKKQYPNATQSVLQKAKYEEKKFECTKENS